jgi:hypothetical protein
MQSYCAQPVIKSPALTDAELCRTAGSHSGDHEQFCLLRRNAVYFVKSQLTFRRNMLPPHLRGSKKALLFTHFHAGFLLDLYFDTGWRPQVPLKRRLTSNGLHGVISQKIQFFKHRALEVLSVDIRIISKL